MSYIECYSHMTGKNVKYNLIGVKLKHQKKNQDYGCSTDNYSNVYCNTSPYKISTLYRPPGAPESRTLDIYGTSGFITQSYDASGVLSSEYHNSNTGSNPVISSRTYDIEDMQVGENTEDLFSTDMIKVRITTVKKKASDVIVHNWAYTDFQKLDGTYENKDNLYLISNVVMDFILLSNNEIVGSVDLMAHQYNGFFPTRFSMNSELFNLIDFDPQYQSELQYSHYYSLWFSMSQQTNKGIMVNGSKETTKHDFVGLIHSLLAAEGWYAQRNGYNFKQFQIQKSGGGTLTDREINIFNVNGDILFFRHMIQTQPNEFIQFNKGYANAGVCFTPDAQTAWINSYMAEKGYLYADPSGTHNTFMTNVFNQSPILMPMYNDMYIPLTNDIKAGEAPDPEPEEEELIEAIDGDTTYDNDLPPDVDEGYESYTYEGGDVISGTPTGENSIRPSYSNFVFKRYWLSSSSDRNNKLYAFNFIDDMLNVSMSNVFETVYHCVTGHPNISECVARVYALPFEYREIMGDPNNPSVYPKRVTTNECAPYYGDVGILTGRVKLGSNNDWTVQNVYNYYDKLSNRFLQVDLGTTTINRVFNNYLDYTCDYTIHLPYGAGEVQLDPSMLFVGESTQATINLYGWIDFETAMMVIKVIVNQQMVYETSVNIGIELSAMISEKMAVPMFIAKTSLAAGVAYAGFKYRGGSNSPSFEERNEEWNRRNQVKEEQRTARDEARNQQKAEDREASAREYDRRSDKSHQQKMERLHESDDLRTRQKEMTQSMKVQDKENQTMHHQRRLGMTKATLEDMKKSNELYKNFIKVGKIYQQETGKTFMHNPEQDPEFVAWAEKKYSHGSEVMNSFVEYLHRRGR